MDTRLEGKIAIVVGAGQTPGDKIGNGRAISLQLAREGAEVICVDRLPDRAEETAALIREEGLRAIAYVADVSRAADCEKLVQHVYEQRARIDILINNVGIGRGDAPPHAIEEVAWDKIMDVNLKAMTFTIRHALAVMREQRGGAIVNISSLAALAGHHMVTYEVSKAAVNRLTTVVALANAKYGVRCNAVMPGLIDTPMAIEGIAERTGQSREALRADRDARVPMGRMGSAWDIANAATFLCSDAARYITGVVLPVDGGMAARVG
ncbi:MAG: SDR family NAD(P)-dependent oxidoreductase [Hyphomonadaceae bacterium]